MIITREAVRKLFILIVAAVFAAGCAEMRERREGLDPFEYMYPAKIEWDDPQQVLKSFYGAKKRGDWKMAFKICDFTEVLPRAEAKRIREEWKKDSVNWEDRYLFHNWYVVEIERKDGRALMAVTEFYVSKTAEEGVAQANYNEEMVLYRKKWKLVAALPLNEEELGPKKKGKEGTKKE